MNRIAFKSHFLLLACFYAPPLFYYLFFRESYEDQYRISYNPLFFVLGSLLVYSTFLSFFYRISKKVKIKQYLSWPINFVVPFFQFVVIAYLFCSIYFFFFYDISFRHTSRLYDGGYIIILMFHLYPIILAYLLFAVIFIIQGGTFGFKSWLNIVFLLLSIMLSANAAIQILVIAILLMMIFFPSFFYKEFKISKILLMSFFIAPLGFGVIFFGLINKVGYQAVVSGDYGSLSQLTNIVITRMGSSMMSIATIFNENNFWADNFRVTERVFESFISTFYNRLLLIIPTLGSFNYDLIETINRINFTRIYEVSLLRAGASPGPVASMFYVPLFPIGLILLPLFYAYIIRCIDRHLIRDFRYNIFTLLSIGIFLLPIFEAPLNIFYIIDPMFVFLCILLIYKRINIFRLYEN